MVVQTPIDMMIAAMNYTDYENSKACGDHILVRASNGATVTVLITSECPLPCADAGTISFRYQTGSSRW